MLKYVPEPIVIGAPNPLELDVSDISLSVDKWKELGPISLPDLLHQNETDFEELRIIHFKCLTYGFGAN
jgi:hypothetical protein